MTSSALPQPRHRWFAAFYDRLLKSSDHKMAPLRSTVVANASGRVLELGCGTGANFAFYDWSKVDSLVATEPDPFMLQRASAKLNAVVHDPASRAKASIVPAPAESLPYPDASFDCIVATFVLCTVSELPRSIAEAYRVLAPGGTMRFLEHVAGSGLIAGVQRSIQPVYGWTAAGCHLTNDTEAALVDAGFMLDIESRPSLAPIFPCILGVATKPR